MSADPGAVTAVVRVGDTGPYVADPAAASRRMRLIRDAYGLRDRGTLLGTIS